ncbi:NifU N-terminal domain-containing protein [Candidatus Uabimicrobium amorphum]|uniref:Scaffold protein Nfu/NifU N-terminal domain-containing protein n=1 Tax=Uabimicrobium amorphum TaxID=2596890 RepID=A0A5S9IWA6_UABAM|nr:NifU N-terminal domain-containing protein [Candidatus Uabimicrobium amorphum]BBM88260.1 hypothetical protein UABAM_06681 [Candidatus Uabimicrobium amorphum]
MKIVQKFPANPNMVIFFIPQQQTTKMAEMFATAAKARTHLFAHYFFEIDGVRRVQITRYEIRVFKRKDLHVWDEILPQIVKTIKNIFPQAQISPWQESAEKLTRIFPGKNEKREVYEGVEVANAHPIAKSLFRVCGVERVILDIDHIEVKLCSIFPVSAVWSEVAKVLE